jgi:hypothetical protein
MKRRAVDPETNRRVVRDDDDVVRDGERVRVPLMMRDGLPGRVFRDEDGVKTEAADWQIDYVRDCKVAHSVGLEDGEALHRPGARHCTDAAANDARVKAYFDAVEEMQNAWRAPGLPRHEPRGNVTGYGAGAGENAPPAGSYPLSAGEGSRCTINGQDGVLRRTGDGPWLECVPVDEDRDHSETDARDAAWNQMVADMESAWKRAR